MEAIKFILNAFGYRTVDDFGTTVFKWPLWGGYWIAGLSAFGGLVSEVTGLQWALALAFVLLIIAETWTGLRVAYRVKGEKWRSRKFGRMLLKIGTYIFILSLLNTFAEHSQLPEGIVEEYLNPFRWMYYVVFIWIVMQLWISYLENLGLLGYSETRGLVGFILRKFNKWFEFDGKKDNNY